MSKLFEALEIEGADFIGNAKGYDLFDVRSWDAAQRFVIENTDDPAGVAYVHDERTFNNNINDNQRLYFFAKDNTNRVFGAVVKSPSTTGTVEFVNIDQSATISVTTNFLYEHARTNSNKCFQTNDAVLPLYLIPDAEFTGANADGCYLENRSLVGAISSLTAEREIALDDLPENIIYIEDKAFTYGLKVTSIYLRNTMMDIDANQLQNVEHIKVSFVDPTEKPESWDTNWDNGKDITYGYGLTTDEIARMSQEVADRLAQERERREREAEIERENARKLARQLRYKVEGKGVTILGTRPDVTELQIPEEIEGKPVTKIAARAFAYSDLESVTLPSTLKIIEREAFFNSNQLRGWQWIDKSCIIGKDAFAGTHVTVSRRR